MPQTNYKFKKMFYSWDPKKSKSTHIVSELQVSKNELLVIENKQAIGNMWCVHSFYIPGKITYGFLEKTKTQSFYLLGKEMWYYNWENVRRLIKGFESKKAKKYKFDL